MSKKINVFTQHMGQKAVPFKNGKLNAILPTRSSCQGNIRLVLGWIRTPKEAKALRKWILKIRIP